MRTQVVTTSEQLQSCLQIRREVFIEEQGVPEELEIDELDHVDACTHLLMTDDAGRALATARIKRYDERTAKVQRVAVRRSARGRGYGAVLLEAAEEVARKQGYERVVLDAQCQAEGFYRKLGYRLVSPERFFDAGIEHVRMEKAL
jgi:predicted GNAT family N-acyltransferase